jgi:hypothetical protein
MRIRELAFPLFVLPLAAWGQMDDNSLTVVATRTIALQPDQVQFAVYVNFESTAGLADVLAAVQSIGITEANLISVSTTNPLSVSTTNQGLVTTQWYFVLAVPFSKQGDTLSALSALQRSVGQNPNRSLGYSVQGAQVSSQLQASATCPYVGMFQDAIAQAQPLASAAGQMLGPVLTVSDGTSVDGSGVGQVPTAAFLIGDFAVSPVILDPLGGARLTGIPLAGFISHQIPAPTSQSCTLVVKFKLLH